MKVLIPRETGAERRVAATPETVKLLVGDGFEVNVERGAGGRAHISDTVYQAAGARVLDQVEDCWRSADLVLQVTVADGETTGTTSAVQMTNIERLRLLKEGAVLVAFVTPFQNLPVVRLLQERRVTTFAMEMVPRISRAQAMDALSSQASIAGYRAVVVAATHLDKYFPLLMTAAGTIQPARVVVMGAGVAGLQAVATARRLGALVEVSDIRPAVKEQVESLGAKFIAPPEMEGAEDKSGYAKEVSAEFLRAQQALIQQRVRAADVVITTALVPGKHAPRLITAGMVEEMREGAVIVDLAVAQGGNCELSEIDQVVKKHGVTIIGDPNLAAGLPGDASRLYARNVAKLVNHITVDASLHLDLEDEITHSTLLTHDGQILDVRTAEALNGGSATNGGPTTDGGPTTNGDEA